MSEPSISNPHSHHAHAASWQPPEHRHAKMFQFDDVYGSEPSDEVEEAWTNLIPSKRFYQLKTQCLLANHNMATEGKGYIALPYTTDLTDLPGLNKSWEGDHRAAISVFHQLHCLVSRHEDLDGATLFLLTNIQYLTRDGFFAAKEGTLDEMPNLNTKHLVHCFEYLRQCIMCSADTTLEWIGPDETGTTGWGYEHTCKDFGAIYAWAEERRYRELQTIH
jgi:hypothetical protein